MAHIKFAFSLLPPEVADTIVVYGCSAGGLATLTWLETISEMALKANPKVKVMGLVDAGFFVDYPSNRTGNHDYGNKIKSLVNLVNKKQPIPNSKCVEDNPNNPHYCMLAEHLINYITTPFFVS